MRWPLLVVLGACTSEPMPRLLPCLIVPVPHATIRAHMPLAGVRGATIRFCRDHDCGSAVFPNEFIRGAHFAAEVHDCSTGDGYGCIEIVTNSGPFINGQVFATSVFDMAAATLFDLERPVQYEQAVACKYRNSSSAEVDWYPTSRSGVLCSNERCDAGVHLVGSFRTTDVTTPVTIDLCRDGLGCAQATLLVGHVGVGIGVPELGVETFADGDAIGYDVSTREDPIMLADGDLYTLLITQGDTVLASGQRSVTYSTDYLNGRTCDPVPCRTARVAIP